MATNKLRWPLTLALRNAATLMTVVHGRRVPGVHGEHEDGRYYRWYSFKTVVVTMGREVALGVGASETGMISDGHNKSQMATATSGLGRCDAALDTTRSRRECREQREAIMLGGQTSSKAVVIAKLTAGRGILVGRASPPGTYTKNSRVRTLCSPSPLTPSNIRSGRSSRMPISNPIQTTGSHLWPATYRCPEDLPLRRTDS